MEEGLEEILESSCGLDVHKDKIEACILKTGAKAAYRERFGCISSELTGMLADLFDEYKEQLWKYRTMLAAH